MLATFEVIFYGLNQTICTKFIIANDMGGSMYIHTFGAYFGISAAGYFSSRKAIRDQEERCEGRYDSQLIAMLGTLFLFMYWPSFNGA